MVLFGNMFRNGDDRAQDICHCLLEAIVETRFPRHQLLRPIGADQAVAAAFAPKRPGQFRFRASSRHPLPEPYRDAAVLLDVGEDQRAGVQPHRLHGDVAVVDSPAATERRNIVICVLGFRKTGEIIPRLTNPETGVDALTSELGTKPVGGNGPASRQIVKTKQHVRGKVPCVSIANGTTIEQAVPQTSLRVKDASAEVFHKGWMPLVLASPFHRPFPLPLSCLRARARRSCRPNGSSRHNALPSTLCQRSNESNLDWLGIAWPYRNLERGRMALPGFETAGDLPDLVNNSRVDGAQLGQRDQIDSDHSAVATHQSRASARPTAQHVGNTAIAAVVPSAAMSAHRRLCSIRASEPAITGENACQSAARWKRASPMASETWLSGNFKASSLLPS